MLGLGLGLVAPLLLPTLPAVEAGNLLRSNIIAPKDTMSYSFSLKVSDFSVLGQVGQLLFWSEGWNLLGLLPPSNNGGKARVAAFMADDVPTSWAHAVDVEEDKWYKVKVDFTPSSGVTISLDGVKLGSAPPPAPIATSSASALKTDIINFDFAEQWTLQDGFELWLDDMDVIAGSKVPSKSVNQSDCITNWFFNW